MEAVANARLPDQFVVAVVDGIGWLRRRSDLQRIYDLRQEQRINGLYTLGQISYFKKDLEEALKVRYLI